MDLDALGRADLGWRFVTSYVEESGDHDLNCVLDFYKCYRAFVRGKVRSLRLDQADDSERSSIHQEAESDFQLAAAYAGGLPRRSLVVLCGLPASGKSTLASALSRRLGMVHVNTDVVRKQTAGQLPTAPQAAEFNAGLYTERMTRATYSLLNRRARRWLRREVPVVLDGTFSTRALRLRAAQVARRSGAAFTLVYTSCDERATHRRLQARSASPSVSDADFEVYTRMRQVFEPPDEVSDPELVTDPTGGQNASSIAERLLERGFTGHEGSGQ
jgi:hypothetical protein